jgi:hypothetical protein
MQNKVNDIVAAYQVIEATKKFMCIALDFAWMYSKEEDPTHRTLCGHQVLVGGPWLEA